VLLESLLWGKVQGDNIHRALYHVFPTYTHLLLLILKETGNFLLDFVFEDADVFVPRNLDREHPLFLVTKNKAVEQKGPCTHHVVTTVIAIGNRKQGPR